MDSFNSHSLGRFCIRHEDSCTVPPRSPLAEDRTPIDTEGNLIFDGLEVRVGQSPIALHFVDLYRRLQEQVPATLQALAASHNLHLICFSVSVNYAGDYRYAGSVKSLQIVLEFSEKDLSIQGLMPCSVVARKTTLDIGFSAALGANGTVTSSLPDTELIDQILPISGSAQVRMSTGVNSNFIGNVSMSVLSPETVATGLGDRKAKWQFKRTNNRLLLGDQCCIATIATEKQTTVIHARASVGALIKPHWWAFSNWYDSDDIELTIPLQQDMDDPT